MCEILAVKWPEPRPFSAIAGWAGAMEYYGSGRFGWGVAWLDETETKTGTGNRDRQRAQGAGASQYRADGDGQGRGR